MNVEMHDEFVEKYGEKSGIPYKVAMHESGLELTSFEKVEKACEIEGKLKVKIWTKGKAADMLWGYVETHSGELISFPTFKYSGDNKNGVQRTLMALPLGHEATFVFLTNSKNKVYCDAILPKTA